MGKAAPSSGAVGGIPTCVRRRELSPSVVLILRLKTRGSALTASRQVGRCRQRRPASGAAGWEFLRGKKHFKVS